jgi:hypothetical protein
MATIETDYLVVGAGASATAFSDALIAGREDPTRGYQARSRSSL